MEIVTFEIEKYVIRYLQDIRDLKNRMTVYRLRVGEHVTSTH